MANSYEYLPLPSVSGEYGDYVSPELLYSTAGFTQNPATIKGGQGELLAGTILSRVSAGDKRFVKYTGAVGQVARGFLRRGVDTGAAGAADQGSNIVVKGIVKLELVQAAHGGAVAAASVIASAATDLKARVDDAASFISL